jgi:hypothetical protein
MEPIIATTEQSGHSGHALFLAHGILSKLNIPFILDKKTLRDFLDEKPSLADEIQLAVHYKMWPYADRINEDMQKAGFITGAVHPRRSRLSGMYEWIRKEIKITLEFKEWKKESRKVWWMEYICQEEDQQDCLHYRSVPAELLEHAVMTKITIPIDPEDGIIRRAELQIGIPDRAKEYLEYLEGSKSRKNKYLDI